MSVFCFGFDWSVITMKNINYESDCHFILHQPFLHDGVRNYNKTMHTEPYQALFYEFQTVSGDDRQDYVTYIPNGCMDILFIQDRNSNYMEILGSSIQAKQIRRLPDASYFGIRLKPGLFLSFCGLTLKEITNQEFLFQYGNDDLEMFFKSLKQAESLQERTELFHAYFDTYINVSEVNDLTAYMLSEINESQGNVRIHELADTLHYSERHISRIFLDSMGFTPKTFARIVRFQNVVDSILHQPMQSLCEYMSELGYSDQAHFQREFKQYTGITPKRFLTYAQDSDYCFSSICTEQQAS